MGNQRTTGSFGLKQSGFSLSGKIDKLLFRFGSGHAKLMLILQIAYQAASAVIAVFFGMAMFKLIGVAGVPAFFEAALAGLTLQASSLAFSNGTVAVIVLLLLVYGALSLFMISISRILCDAAALLCLFFSLTVPLYQFPDVVVPAAAVYAIWAIHRVVLGTLVFRFQKLTTAVRFAHLEKGNDNA